MPGPLVCRRRLGLKLHLNLDRKSRQYLQCSGRCLARKRHRQGVEVVLEGKCGLSPHRKRREDVELVQTIPALADGGLKPVPGLKVCRGGKRLKPK